MILDALTADPELFRELRENNKNGLNFEHVNARVLREIVVILQERIHDLGFERLRIRLEPVPPVQTHHSKPYPPKPTRLIVRDADISWKVPVQVLEMGIFVRDKFIRTGGCEDAVPKLAQAIIDSIKGVIRPSGRITERSAMCGH